MPASKRSPTQIEYDRKEIARRYLKGETQAAIAETLGLSQGMISYDLARIKEAWLESAIMDFNEMRSRELARIDVLEREYWQAWQVSQSDRTRKSRAHKEGGQHGEERKVSETVEQRDGNPAFLAGVQWCIAQRCKLFGLYEPERFAIVDWRKEAGEKGINAGEIFEEIVNEYVSVLATGDGAVAE